MHYNLVFLSAIYISYLDCLIYTVMLFILFIYISNGLFFVFAYSVLGLYFFVVSVVCACKNVRRIYCW